MNEFGIELVDLQVTTVAVSIHIQASPKTNEGALEPIDSIS